LSDQAQRVAAKGMVGKKEIEHETSDDLSGAFGYDAL